MRYAVHTLGHCRRGDAVIVELSGNAANVSLMDAANLNNYKAGRQYRYADGGHFTRSPIQLTVPSDGTWYVTVDLGGGRGRVASNVRVVQRS